MRTDIEPFCVSPSATIRAAISQIEENATGIAIVVADNDTLVGTVTDGDVRRGLLRGVSLDETVMTVVEEEPVAVHPDVDEAELSRLFRQQRLKLIPVVSDDEKVLGVHLFNDRLQSLDSKPDDEFEAEQEFPAVIMAGGLGTRLRPLTEDKPKPLVEVGGKPILERILEHLSRVGADDCVITTRYLAEQIEDYFGDGQSLGLDIEYLREEERLGTAGSLRELRGTIERSFLVMNADILTDVDVGEMYQFHEEREALMTVGVRHYSMKVPYGVVEVDGATIDGLSEKPVYDFFVNTGIYVVAPEALRYLPEEGYFDMTELIDNILSDGREVVHFPIIEQWMDIGRPEDVEKANEEFAQSQHS